MTKQNRKDQALEDAARDSRVVWFALLEHALRAGDQGREERARRELRRLGVDVLVDRRAPFLAAADADGEAGK